MSYQVVYMYENKSSFDELTRLVDKKFTSIPKLIKRMEVGETAVVRILKGTWAGYYHTVEKTGLLTYSITRRPQMEY